MGIAERNSLAETGSFFSIFLSFFLFLSAGQSLLQGLSRIFIFFRVGGGGKG